VTRIGIDTHDEAVVYLRGDSPVVRSEGFEPMARVRLERDGRQVVAQLNIVDPQLLDQHQAGLSEAAWDKLAAQEDDEVRITHPEPLESMRYVRGKVYGQRLTDKRARAIVRDVVAGRYNSEQIAAFLTGCAGQKLDVGETVSLARAMIDTGERLSWETDVVVDKHSVGGLPGNRTTPIVVAIAAAAGLTIPKTSSRAITSPAGTADTMATITNVDLCIERIREVVNRENGCMVWGGHVRLAPADDILIRVGRVLDLDSHAQLAASVLSKKVAAGSTHVTIDMPIGPTAKVRSDEQADELERRLGAVGEEIGLNVQTVRGPGLEPIGRGIGPGPEARDILAVLRCADDAPADLRERSLELAGRVLEMGSAVDEGQARAREILDSSRAREKFQAICHAQGGLYDPPEPTYTHDVTADRSGTLTSIDNRRLGKVAKLAGAPDEPEAGLVLEARLGDEVAEGDPLFTVLAENEGELAYSLEFVQSGDPIFEIED
jgi:thymidine phosphorylase